MNPHILSPLERQRISDFLIDNQESPAIRNIRSRARKNYPRLMKDLLLIAVFFDDKELYSVAYDRIDWEAENR